MNIPSAMVKPPALTLADRAYRVVREKILRGDYSFGTVIPRRELAAELGMSLVPLNEALARLENEHLIENTPRVGTKVRTPSPLEIRGFWAVREGLETQAARIYTRKATQKERGTLIEMGRNLDELHIASTSSDEPDKAALHEWRMSHMRFHTWIAECTKLPFLTEAITKNQMLVFNWFYDHQLYGGRRLPARWHEQLAVSLAEGSEESADAAMRKHLHNRLEELMQSLEQYLLMDNAHLTQWNADAVAGVIQKQECTSNG